MTKNHDMATPNVGMHPGASAATDIPIHSKLPVRKSPRATFHDYSGGNYFITICTHEKKHYFGKILDGEMRFSEIGKYADEALRTLHTHYKYVKVPLYVVMPNHIHAIISIVRPSDAPGCIPTTRTALGVVVGGYKQAVTRFARRNNIVFGWQSRYHDHIIRDSTDGNKIADYILHNIARWDSDCHNLPPTQ